MLIPLLLIFGGAAAAIAAVVAATSGDERPPDLPVAPPGMTRYKRINQILTQLQRAAEASGIPLGVLVGWIAVESGGRLDEKTSLDERGYFQLIPDESKTLGVDHQRLSTDSDYSIGAGVKLIQHYMRAATKHDIAPPGSTYFWKLVKLCHTVGSGDVKKLVEGARRAGATGSWEAFERYSLGSPDPRPKHHNPKWFKLIERMFDIGAPFGVGSTTTVVGAKRYDDIPDPLDCI